MKRLMIATLAAGFAACVYAAYNPIDISDAALGFTGFESSDDIQYTAQVDRWNNLDSGTVTAYGDKAKPKAFGDFSADDNFLHIDTESGVLERTFTSMDDWPMDHNTTNTVNMGEIYIDTAVKFTAFDGDAAPEVGVGAQFALWLKAKDAEGEDPGATNLMVKCATYNTDGFWGTTNVVLDVNVKPEEWHRLTIKTLVDTAEPWGEKGLGCFLVYIDGDLIHATTESYSNIVFKVGEAEEAVVLNEGLTYWQNRQLFPSMVNPAAPNSGTLTSISFQGSGDIDMFNITDMDPYNIPTESISLDQETLTLTVGQSATLTATVLPENATDKTVAWESDDESVVTVEDGVVTAEGEGEATITATTVDGFEATCTVTVQAGSPTVIFLAAIENAKDGDTVTATGDIALTETLNLNKSITINLDGNTLSNSNTGWLIDVIGKQLVVSNGTITANDMGIQANGASGLKLYKVAITAQNRALRLRNDATDLIPGEFLVDADSTVISLADDAILCGNGNSTAARTVTIDGAVTGVTAAMTLSGNNTATIDGSLTMTGNDDYPALYYGGTWCENKDNAGTQPTLTVNGTITGVKYAICTDPGDHVGVNLTISDANAKLIASDGDALNVCVPGTFAISAGTFTGNVVSTTAEKFISGGTFGVELDVGLIADGYYAKANGTSPETWTVLPKTGFMVIIAEVETYFETFKNAIDAASEGDTIYILADASVGADEVTKAITVDIAASKTVTVTGEGALENDLTVVGAGALVRGAALDVEAELDLAALEYAQTTGCTGGFNIAEDGIVYMPIGVTYPDATLAVNTKSSDDGAQIVVGGATGTTYTWGNGFWNEGTEIAVAKIGDKGYTTFDAAYTAAKAGDTLTLLADMTLADTLVVDKAITLDLGTKTVTMAPTADMGVNVKAAATIKNGKFVSSRTTDGGYAIVTDPAIAATYEDLEIDGAHYRFVFTCDSEASDIQAEFDAKPTVKVTCKNVDVKGNGTLFYAQHTLLDLDAYCSATAEGTPSTVEPYHAALYSALNATITVAGGTYANTNALVVGNLGGKIVIEDGTLTGNIKSYMYKDDDRFTNNVATVEIKGGTIKGGFTFADDQAGACTKEEVKWNVTGGSFSSDPSSYVAKGYKAIFNGMTTTWAVVKAYEVKDVTTKGGSLSFDPSEAAEGETVTVTPSASSGYTFQPGSITSTDVTISGDTFVMPAKDVEVSATFTANIYNVTAATGLTGGTVGVDRNTATVEDTVNVTAEPDTANGYKLVAVKVNGNAIQGTSFQMWAQDVTVSAEFSNMYTLTVPTVANATAVVSNGAEQATAPYTFAYNTEVKVYWTAAEGYQITAGAVETITMNGDKTAAEPTVAEAPSKPMSDEAETSEVDPSTGICVVTPKDSSTTEVTIKNGAQFGGARFEIPSTVKTIKGVDSTQVLVKNGDIVIPDGALTFSGDATAGVTYDLNPEGVVNEVPVQPTIGSGVESTEVKPADGAVAVKAIAGLYYSLVRGDDPATVQTAGTVTDSAQAEATGETVELTDETEKGSKGFYIIKVTIDNPEE